MRYFYLTPFLFLILLLAGYQTLLAQGTWHYLPNAPIIYEQSYGVDRYEDVYFVSDTEGWAASFSGTIIHTTDGGNSWTSQTSTISAYRKLLFLNNQIGFVGTVNGYETWVGGSLLKTLDGGQTWINLTNALTDTGRNQLADTGGTSICGMSHAGMNNIYAVGAWFQPGHFMMSHDTGQTWTYSYMGQVASALVECKFLDSLTGFISGMAADTSYGIILKTTDGGITWRTVFKSNRGSEYVWKMQFLNNSLAYASIESLSGDSTLMAKTTDGGETWTEMLVNPFNINAEGIGFADSLHGWIGGYSYGTFATSDGGATWNYTNFGDNLNRVFFIRPTLLYGAGASIYKYDTIAITGTSKMGAPGAQPQQLLPCRPNPFSGSTTVSFSINEPTVVDLRVFDASGKYITTLLNKRMEPGTYTVPWVPGACASGEYVIVMGTNLRFTSTKVQYINK